MTIHVNRAPDPSAPPTILLVDDRPENLLAYRGILGDMEANLLEAASGEEALRCLLLEPVALILLDVQMPGMDGFETATLIRGNPRFEHTPILFVTAGDKTEAKQAEGYDAGAVDFLFKPLVPTILRSKVRVFMELHRKTEQLREQAVVAEAAAQKLEEQARELERSNEELEQYAYIISHDLQQPARVIVSFLGLLSERCAGELDAEAEQFIQLTVDAASRMTEQLSGLLAHARVSTGSGEPPVQVDCDDVLQGVRENLQLMIDESGAALVVEPLPTVQGYPNLLLQLFQNLVQNAIKFRSDAPPRVEVRAERQGTGWRFEVRDNGIGFDPQFAERIFEIFQRLHTREEFDGTGMGLAIARKIVEAHSGTIAAESQQGAGARFLFTIPDAGLPEEA
jgi:two-component system, sensor histidine kinase and response regulator